MRRIALFSLLFGTVLFSGRASAQPILFNHCFGGSNADEFTSIIQTSDGGFACTGYSRSSDDDLSRNFGGPDVWVVKLNSAGAVQWKKSFGGSGVDSANCIYETSDNYLLIAGMTSSTDSGIIGNHGNGDAWIIKLDLNGNLQWQKVYGGSNLDVANAIVENSSTGDYVFCGSTLSSDGDVSGNYGARDVWVGDINPSGTLQWKKCFGGSNDETGYDIIATADGGTMVCGQTKSYDGIVTGDHAGAGDAWLVKLSSAGALQWEHCYGGTQEESANSIVQRSDGGYTFAGRAGSTDGDVHGLHFQIDAWVASVNSSGTINWQHTLGGHFDDEAYSIFQTTDDGYLVGGQTGSNDGDAAGNHGGGDAWILKLDSVGNLSWQHCLGGTGTDQANSVIQAANGKYFMAGYTGSTDGDISNNHGNNDAWLTEFGNPDPPIIDYITPDAGAPGMCVAVEMVGPANATQNFGDDQYYSPDVPNTNDLIVTFPRPSDSLLVQLGPYAVSWNGRLLQQMFLINPHTAPIDTEIYFQVNWQGQASAIDSFLVVTPTHFAPMIGSGTIPTTGRTKRNTLVIDSMVLSNGTYTFSQTDPDAATPGNQSYLPVRILSMGPVRLSGAVLKVDGQNGATSSAGGNGGPGGGGGGAGYPGKGGDGFTGGGGNNDGSNGPGGAGTGVAAPTAWNGGYSLTGVPGGLGEQHSSGGGDDGGGGGTGHPFGTSGVNGNRGNSPTGGFGGASAGGSTTDYTTDYGGGGGGNAFAGAQGQGTGSNGGQIVGNPMIVPFAGGSGGGGGNQTYVSLIGGAGGPGGGGGGAIDVTSFASFSMGNGDVEATGGAGGNGNHSIEPAAAGGGGSGGAVSISARDSVVIFSSASLNVAGGAAGTSSSNNGGAGGAGRIRINGFASKSASASSNNFFPIANSATGPSIQRVTFAGDSVSITGFDQFWDATPSGSPNIDLYYLWPSSGGDWGDTNVVWVSNAGSHSASWKGVLPISPNAADTVLYLVAMQTENPSSGTFVDVPSGYLSHTSGIIAHVVGPPKDSVYPGKINFGDVLLGACSNDTIVTVYSIGHSPLLIDSAKLVGANNTQFRIKTGFPIAVNPGTSTTITLAFCPDSLICPMTATLMLYTNAGDTTVTLTGCSVQPQMVIHPLVLDFGRVHVGLCKDSSVVVSNPGKDPLTISSETIFGAQFQALDPLPMIVTAGDSDTIRIRFCPSDTALALGSDTVRSDAPQSPIGIQLLGEGKVGILSIDSIIDFGLVHLDSCKDTVVYARNTGNDSLLLKTGPFSTSGFSLVSPLVAIEIPAHDSTPIDLRFCATDLGNFTTTENVTTDIPSSKAVVLRAFVGLAVLQLPPVIDFGTVATGGCKDTTIPINNIGTDTLFLAPDTNFHAPFSYVGNSLIIVPPGGSANVTFQFCPLDTNEASELTQFDTIGHGRNQSFTLLGKGVEGALATSGPIDIGCIAVDSSATVTVTIRNTGAATLQNIVPSATPLSNVTIVHYPPTSLGAGVSDSVVLIVSPSAVGSFSGTLTISSSSTPITIPITAEISTPPAIVSLDTVLAFDSTNTGDSSVVKCVTIVNYSCVGISLSSIAITGQDSSDFEILSVAGGPELSDSIPAIICIRYTPKAGGNAFAVLTGIGNGTVISLAKLTGSAVGKSVAVELAIDTVAGVPGQTVNVPVRALNDVTAGSITTVDFRVVFNPMQLDLKVPTAPATWSIESSSTPTYQLIQHSIGDKEFIATFPTPLTGKPIIANLPFEILEPISNTATIHLMSATFGTSNSTLASTSDGLVQIEQCDTTSRLTFVPPAIDVAPNDPNPFSSMTHVSVTVRTAGHVKIEVYNALGSKVLTPFDADLPVGTETISIDATPLPPGAYRSVTTWSWPAGTPLPPYQPATMRSENTMIVLGQ